MKTIDMKIRIGQLSEIFKDNKKIKNNINIINIILEIERFDSI
jgi:hypothetical protein